MAEIANTDKKMKAYKTFSQLGQNERAKYFAGFNVDKGSILPYVMNRRTHVYQRHVDISEIDMLQRMFTDPHVHGGTSFNAESVDYYLADAINKDAEGIAAWLDKSRVNEFDYELNYTIPSKKHINSPNKDLIDTKKKSLHFSRGKCEIKETSTNALKIILRRDDGAAATSPFGFYIVTMKTDQYSPNTKPTHRDMREAIHQTDYYKQASVIQKAQLDFANKKPKPELWLDATYTEKFPDRIRLGMKDPKDGNRVTITLSEGKASINKPGVKNADGFSMSFDEIDDFMKDNPKVADSVKYVADIIFKETGTTFKGNLCKTLHLPFGNKDKQPDKQVNKLQEAKKLVNKTVTTTSNNREVSKHGTQEYPS